MDEKVKLYLNFKKNLKQIIFFKTGSLSRIKKIKHLLFAYF